MLSRYRSLRSSSLRTTSWSPISASRQFGLMIDVDLSVSPLGILPITGITWSKLYP